MDPYLTCLGSDGRAHRLGWGGHRRLAVAAQRRADGLSSTPHSRVGGQSEKQYG